MKKNSYEELSDEKLLKKKDLVKGVLLGFAVVFILAIAAMIYLFATKGSKDIPIAVLTPFFTMPVFFVPLVNNLGLLNKEIKSRDLSLKKK